MPRRPSKGPPLKMPLRPSMGPSKRPLRPSIPSKHPPLKIRPPLKLPLECADVPSTSSAGEAPLPSICFVMGETPAVNDLVEDEYIMLAAAAAVEEKKGPTPQEEEAEKILAEQRCMQASEEEKPPPVVPIVGGNVLARGSTGWEDDDAGEVDPMVAALRAEWVAKGTLGGHDKESAEGPREKEEQKSSPPAKEVPADSFLHGTRGSTAKEVPADSFLGRGAAIYTAFFIITAIIAILLGRASAPPGPPTISIALTGAPSLASIRSNMRPLMLTATVDPPTTDGAGARILLKPILHCGVYFQVSRFGGDTFRKVRTGCR